MDNISKLSFTLKIRAFIALLKLRLTSLVVMSAFFGFLLADGNLSSYAFFNLILGGILITGSSNGFNQIIEHKTDELMSRTFSRPLPSKVLSIVEALVFCIITELWGYISLLGLILVHLF